MQLIKNDISSLLYIVFSILIRDGLISSAEISKVKSEILNIFNVEISEKEIDKYLEGFFNSNIVFEEYLEKITDKNMRVSIIKLAKICASADGLHETENIAIEKALQIWRINQGDVNDRL